MNHSTNPIGRIVRVLAWRHKLRPMLAGCMLISWVAVAAVVSMQRPTSGGELRIPVMLYGDGDEALSGLQFDLNYDITAFELVGVNSGGAASDAGKEVILTETVPGQGRVLITGFNNTELFDGHVATVILRPLQSDAPSHDISIDRVLASDPDGNRVPIDYEDRYQFPPAAPEKAESPEQAPATSEESVDNTSAQENEDSQESLAVDDSTRPVDSTADTAPITSADSTTSASLLRSTEAQAPAPAGVPSPLQRSTNRRALPHANQHLTAETPGALDGTSANITPAHGGRLETGSTVTDASRATVAAGRPRGNERALFDEIEAPGRLALAAPMSDGFPLSGDPVTQDGIRSDASPAVHAQLNARFAAAALGPLVFAGMILIRSLVFGRRARPAWRRPR